MKTKFAIGCLVQWYESEIIKEYIETLNKACSSEKLKECIRKINKDTKPYTVNIKYGIHTIADYRRNFNNEYCDKADVLIWGESDMLVPSQMFTILDGLHKQSPVSKYIATFGICKMWDDSWKALTVRRFNLK